MVDKNKGKIYHNPSTDRSDKQITVYPRLEDPKTENAIGSIVIKKDPNLINIINLIYLEIPIFEKIVPMVEIEIFIDLG